MPFARSFDEAYAAIAKVGDLVGAPQRAEALIAEIEAALDAARSEPVMSTLILRRQGYATGTNSMTGDLLAQLGMHLESEDLVGARGGFADLERVVRTDPDILILPRLDADAEDQGSALLAHPAIATRFPADRRMILPERLTICAGPALIEAVTFLAAERDRFLARNTDG